VDDSSARKRPALLIPVSNDDARFDVWQADGKLDRSWPLTSFGIMKTQPPHSERGEASQEHWKTCSSTETTSDEGENARLARQHRAEDNGPEAPNEKAPDPVRKRDVRGTNDRR
jgi:hypothetical protein